MKNVYLYTTRKNRVLKTISIQVTKVFYV